MDVLPSGNIFHELQVVHDTGYYDGKVSPEEHWQQVGLVFLKIYWQASQSENKKTIHRHCIHVVYYNVVDCVSLGCLLQNFTSERIIIYRYISVR